jgi:hypothetical protein
VNTSVQGSPVVRPRRRSGRSLNSLAIQLSAFALTFILIALLVVTSSRAAFVAQNANDGNQVSSASIDLADNDSETAMFANVTGLMPGNPVDRCIDVTYTGTVDPLAVLLYASGTPTGTLPAYLDLTIQIGADTGAGFRDCTGFVPTGTLYSGTLAAFGAARNSYATGLTTWDPVAGPDTRTFRFVLTVQNNPAAEALSSTFGFSWETRTS